MKPSRRAVDDFGWLDTALLAGMALAFAFAFAVWGLGKLVVAVWQCGAWMWRGR